MLKIVAGAFIAWWFFGALVFFMLLLGGCTISDVQNPQCVIACKSQKEGV